MHGEGGISRKGSAAGQASHYYSLPRLATRGTLWVDGARLTVSGTSWMDHEFGSGDLGDEQVGWDWFSVQLDNRSELMFYRLRRTDGRGTPTRLGGAMGGCPGTVDTPMLDEILKARGDPAASSRPWPRPRRRT